MPAPNLVLIGERNPYGANPAHALLDWPLNSAGYGLRTMVLGVTRVEYHCHDRLNLLTLNKWSVPAARAAAGKVLLAHPGRVLVLLGGKVRDAFGYGKCKARAEPVAWFTVIKAADDTTLVLLPHPSGRNRMWWGADKAPNVDSCRAALREAAPGVVLGTLP